MARRRPPVQTPHGRFLPLEIRPGGHGDEKGVILPPGLVPTATVAEADDDGATAYRDLVLAETSLVAYWRMGEAAGDQFDYAANPLGDKPLGRSAGSTPGTYNVTGGLPADQDDGAFRFNYNQGVTDGGSNGDFFSAVDSSNHRWAFAATAAFTIECLFKPKSGWSLPSGTAGIVGTIYDTSDPNVQGWGLDQVAFGSGNQVRFLRCKSDGTQTVVTGSALTVDTWAHLVGAYDGTTMRLYVNGALVASSASSVSVTGNDTFRAGVHLVATSQVARYIYGDLDEIAIYNTALTPETVFAHAEAAEAASATDGAIGVYLDGV